MCNYIGPSVEFFVLQDNEKVCQMDNIYVTSLLYQRIGHEVITIIGV
jgi:hypothetical protein